MIVMESRRTITRAIFLFICWIAALPLIASAGDTEIHGYGKQSFMQSSKNNYLDARSGSWGDTAVALVFTNKVSDATTIWVQIFGEASEFSLDWAYVDHRINDDLSVRAGQIKYPVGLINEIRDIQILHLGIMEPIMYREESDVIFEYYRGIGGSYAVGPVKIDLFGGAPILEAGAETGEKAVSTRLLGGRVTYETPVHGLKLVGSVSTFNEEITDAATGDVIVPKGSERTMIASASYERHNFEVNAEYTQNKKIEGDFASYYIEVGYRFFDKLTPFVRYDAIMNISDGASKSDPSNYQKETVVGIGYKLNPYVALKAEERMIDGYFLPVANGDLNMALAKRWSMFTAGVNFMF